MKWTHFYLSMKNPRPEARGITAFLSRLVDKMLRLSAIIPMVVFHYLGSAAWSPNAGMTWEDYLPAIAMVESSNRQWSYSYLGERFGRGRHHVSDIAFEHFKWVHPNHWIVRQGLGPDCLYNDDVNREVALWLLGWLSRQYSGRSNHVALVLSAYNQGLSYTERNGIASNYVEKVIAGMRK